MTKARIHFVMQSIWIVYIKTFNGRTHKIVPTRFLPVPAITVLCSRKGCGKLRFKFLILYIGLDNRIKAMSWPVRVHVTPIKVAINNDTN